MYGCQLTSSSPPILDMCETTQKSAEMNPAFYHDMYDSSQYLQVQVGATCHMILQAYGQVNKLIKLWSHIF